MNILWLGDGSFSSLEFESASIAFSDSWLFVEFDSSFLSSFGEISAFGAGIVKTRSIAKMVLMEPQIKNGKLRPPIS